MKNKPSHKQDNLRLKNKSRNRLVIKTKNVNPKLMKEKIIEFLNSETPSTKITSIFLGLIAVAGIMAVGIAVPNLFSCFGKKAYQNKRRYQNRFSSTINYAKRIKYIQTIKKHHQSYFQLTNKGREALYKEILKNLVIKKQKRWDKTWRIVIFDIPNQYTKTRNFLRYKLKQLEFQPLQKSVFISPWSCFKEIDLLRKAFEVEKYVTFFEAQNIEQESYWKKLFAL